MYFSSSYCISKWPRKLHFTFWFVFLLQANSNLLLPAPSSLSPHSKLRLSGALNLPLNPLYSFTAESGKFLYSFTLCSEGMITSIKIFLFSAFKNYAVQFFQGLTQFFNMWYCFLSPLWYSPMLMHVSL